VAGSTKQAHGIVVYSLRADVFRFATNIRHRIGSACSCQQITNCAVVPISASRSANTSIIQRLRYGAMGGRSNRLYLLDDGKDVGGEGVRSLWVCCHALRLRIPEVGPAGRRLGSQVSVERFHALACAHPGRTYRVYARGWDRVQGHTVKRRFKQTGAFRIKNIPLPFGMPFA
jgi:hypothetical protein